ncbi:WD repeat-containing protein 81-like, partial [Stegodyphus dumicola]|uniref:WD repeat-containing protein 81-like n=1 Tax=Stegodyphus dumicola TaxID=202533 RepID=UPI0015AD69D0
SFNDALQEILKRLYKTTRIEREDGMIIHLSPPPSSAPNQFSDFQDIIHPNLLEIFCAVESPQSIFLICEKNVSTLKDCLMFSPFVLSGSTIRPLFVVYQLLQALCSVHNSGLFMGPITLSSISIKENLWIQVMPLTCLHLDSDKTTSEQYFVASDRHLTDGECSDNKDDSVISSSLTFKPADQNREGDCSYHELTLASLVQDWVNGIISNYDYLIALNKLAGREKDNPHSHYVMPWIMDFSVPDGGWRDLSKSKFRLNKGDKQLDLIYESATEITGTNLSCSSASIPQDSAVMVAHHTSEVLADITYYVYKARRMPKSFLCHHVRQKWVPAEYPATIERLQEWTPDECIPEFFSDPTIFYSIHPDLSDLGVPSWCKSPEDFIKKHREALEGYHVSERLHHWIDLVFGYKLTGPAAVKSKNVCLPLVDHHTSIRNYGMVQLFSHPHPHKLNKCIFSRSIAPKTFRNIVFKVSDTKDSGDDETSSESIGKSGFLKSLRSKSLVLPDNARHEPRPENQTIVLPKDFNPLATLSHFESLFTFLCWAGGGKVGRDETNSQHSASEKMTFYNQVKDLLVLGCLISEIAVASYCKTLPENAVLEERYNNILKLLRLHKQDVPRSFQKVIQLLLQVDSSYHQEYEEITPVPSRYPPVSACGLPLPSAHQLLLSHVHTIPFPHYFPDLYLFLLKLNQFTAEINLLSEITDENGENRKKIENLAEKMVEYAAEQLKVLLPLLNVEGIELLTPYLQEIFENRHTALLATWHLFGMVSQALGPQQTCSKLLTRLTKVFDTDKPSPKHLKLYHRTFLLQIIVGLGLHNFLIHFTTILIEAIGGCKDYSSKNSESDYIYMQNTFEPDVSKLEHMAEDLDECIIDDGDGTYDTAFRQLNSSQETLNVQSEINNDEDNEIFDLDVNEE